MEKVSIGKLNWTLIMAASAVAVVFLNGLAFGLSPESIFDSLIHTGFIASCVSIFVLAAAPLIERYRFSIRFAAIAAGIVPATLAGVFLTKIFLVIVSPFDGYYSLMPAGRTVVFSLVISYIFGLGGYLYLTSRVKLKAARNLIHQKAEAEQRAIALANEAQIASLESRIRPHFLFNTLNSIAALIRENPPAAERMVEQLSKILRYSLDNGTDHLVSLEQELEITRDFLEIQKTRFAEKLEYSFEIDESLFQTGVPTFALHTLVENSIKHVDRTDSGKTSINVSAQMRNDSLVLNVKDNGKGFAEDRILPGHGLENLRDRLKVVCGRNAFLEISNNGSGSVSIIIPQNDG